MKRFYVMMLIKRIVAALLFSSLVALLFLTPASATDSSYAWYIKRNGKKRPEIQKGQEIIYKYDGYFIDKKLFDGDEKKVIYLTFDLGYENGNTEKILNALKTEGISAAFFVLDNIILKNTDLVTRMINEGHTVCNHTKNHKNLCHATDEEIISNLTELEKIYMEKTGKAMSKYFRFPEGKYSENALRCVQGLGYKTIFWSFAYDDWDNNRQMSREKAMKKILENTHNGAVMLFHPTSKVNAEIFPELIKKWRVDGYTFGTLDELVS